MRIIEVAWRFEDGYPLAVGETPKGVVEDPFLPSVTGPRCVGHLTLDRLQSDPTVLLTVTVEHHRVPSGTVWLAARRADGGEAHIRRTEIDRARWSADGRCTFEAPANLSELVHHGVRRHQFTWQWEWDEGNAAARTACGTSEHVLFLTLSVPQDPWRQIGSHAGDRALPWPSALTFATGLAAGARDHAEAARLIVESLWALGLPTGSARQRLRYSTGPNAYVLPQKQPVFFDFELFLTHFAESGRLVEIQCVEATALVTSVANLLGCSLVSVVIDAPNCCSFGLNRILPLGRTSDAGVRNFANHMVAGERGAAEDLSDTLVFDAALKINPAVDPTTETGDWRLAAGLPMGSGAGRTGDGRFLPQLVAGSSVRSCVISAGLPARVIRPRLFVGTSPCELVRFEHFVQLLRMLPAAEAPSSPVFGPLLDGFLRDREATVFTVPRAPELPQLPPQKQFLYKAPAGADSLNVDVWDGSSRDEAIVAMADLLASAQVPMERVAAGSGVAYASPDYGSLVWLVDSSVVRITAGSSSNIDVRTLLPA